MQLWGDYTSQALSQLETNVTACVEESFGRFTRRNSGKPEIWIAADVGITPFATWIQTVTDKDDVTGIYCVANVDTASHLEELQQIVAQHKNFKLVVHESQSSGRLSAQAILDITGPALGTANLLFCGPSQIRQSLATGLAHPGISARRFHYEEFEIRTGIGLTKLAAWLLKRAILKVRQRVEGNQ